MPTITPFMDFTQRLNLFIKKRSDLIQMTLSNIFTMRTIGNKTHGDLAEIAMVEFINQYMYDFSAKHVGKDLYRAKSQEEDITITNDITSDVFPVSLKAYGVGPLQLSTDKDSQMFNLLESKGKDALCGKTLNDVFQEPVFTSFGEMNVLPLIYDEKKHKCKILVFDYAKAKASVTKIEKEHTGRRRIHPVYKFKDGNEGYICEVRYGDKQANALQRGLWTHTKNASAYFQDVTGWIDYTDNDLLVKLFSLGLITSKIGHEQALAVLTKDVTRLKGEKTR